VEHLQDASDAQKIAAIPHREAVLDRIDQHHAPHRAVRFGEHRRANAGSSSGVSRCKRVGGSTESIFLRSSGVSTSSAGSRTSLRIVASKASLRVCTSGVPGNRSYTVTIWPMTFLSPVARSCLRMAWRMDSVSARESASTMVGEGQRPKSDSMLSLNALSSAVEPSSALSLRKSYSKGASTKCSTP